jgi:RsmE family RNA methyltransferase
VNLLLLEPHEVSEECEARVSGVRARHLLRVLKVAPGQRVRVGILDGPLGTGQVQALGDDLVVLHCAFDPLPPPRPRVDLLLAVPRPKVLRRLWSQIAALGVGRILLCNAARVERNYFDTHLLESRIYRPQLIEGLQQAKDTRLPIVSVHRRFRVLVEDELDEHAGDARRIVADPSAPESPSSVLRHADQRVLLAVGPEGGWTRFELDLLEAHGFTSVGVGSRTLRVDTAAIALLTVVHEALRVR